MTPWCAPHPQGCLLHITVKPNAKATAVTGALAQEGATSLAIRLAAKPIDGEANTALLTFLSRTLNLPKSRLILHKGQTGRHKQVLVTGCPPEQALAALTPPDTQP